MHAKQYIQIKEDKKYLENLTVLLKNRDKENIIFISSNAFNIVTAINNEFLSIPVIPFDSNCKDDY